MFLASVPEAPVNEDCDAQARKDDVGSNGAAFAQIEALVLSEAQTPAMQRRAEGDLGAGIASAIGPHGRSRVSTCRSRRRHEAMMPLPPPV